MTSQETQNKIEEIISHDWDCPYRTKDCNCGRSIKASKLISLFDSESEKREKEVVEAFSNNITKRLQRYANTPLSKRTNGWDELVSLRDMLSTLPIKNETIFEAHLWEIVFWVIFIAALIRIFRFIVNL